MGLYRPTATGRTPTAAAPSLDKTTKLPSVRGGRAWATIYPNAGEAVVTTVTPVLKQVDRSRKASGAMDPERCRANAVRRAKVKLRRFCTEHRLRFMWTLTYREGEVDPKRVRRDIEKMIAKIVQDRRGRRFPWVYVLEHHADGARLHVHMAVPFFYKHAKLMKAWGRGIVFCSERKHRGECSFVAARRTAGYLTKYIAKTFENSASGTHRYERAQGFEPLSYKVRRHDMDDGEEFAVSVFNQRPEQVWRSSFSGGWDGPPCRVLYFNGRAPDG